MQKNLPKYTPDWVQTVSWWSESSKRNVRYALCNDRRTLLWFANQRAVEFHPTLVRVDRADHPTYLVLDLDPPSTDGFGLAVRAAQLVRRPLADAGLVGAVKTSGANGLHVFVPIEAQTTIGDVAAATRAIAARAERLDPAPVTTAYIRDDRGAKVPELQPLSTDLIEEGRAIPVARVQAMRVGRRRARARQSDGWPG